MAEPPSYNADLVRQGDRPRYYATLFAPAVVRESLFALYAFASEIARIPRQVSDPTLGELRLEWWRTALEAALGGEGGGESPLLPPFVAAIRRHRLPGAPAFRMIEARIADLYADPPASRGDLEGYLGDTESALFQLAAIVLAGEDAAAAADASGHAGIAYGLARRLGVLEADHARGRSIVPADILAERGLDTGALYAPGREADVASAVGDLAALARRHLAEASRHVRDLPRRIGPAFLPLAVVGPILDRVEARRGAGEHAAAGLSDLGMLARISWAALNGRIGGGGIGSGRTGGNA